MDDVVTFVTKPCPVCELPSQIEVSFNDLERWIQGEHIQNVWPSWDPGQRELLMTGTHDACWQVMWGRDE